MVKADGYGHGAEQVARAALDAGASWLGVALVEEGMTLREQGIDARILVLSEPPPAAAGAVVAHGLTPTVYTAGGIEALAKAVVDAGSGTPLPVHLKVDTGMHRVGCTVDDAAGLVDLVASRPELELEAVCTHFAAADETDHPYTNEQIEQFEALLERARRGRQPTQARARGQLRGPARTPTGALRPRARRDRALRRAPCSRARRSDPAARRSSPCAPGSPT